MRLAEKAAVNAQSRIFATYDWYGRRNLSRVLTVDRVNYVQSCVERVQGKGQLARQTILDVGCGGGLLCVEIARRGAHISGVDPSAGALLDARHYVDSRLLSGLVTLREGGAESLPFADQSFSLVICMDVLEHVRDLSATIREVARVLKPGGIFVFDTINRTFLARLAVIWLGERFCRRWGLVPGLHDYAMFIRPRELKAELVRNQISLQEMTGFVPGIVEGRLTLVPGGPDLISYIGYALKS